MQVQRVLNNNSNTNFGAKLQTKGMKKFPKTVIEELEKAAKPIGKESDIIAIHLNGINEETQVWYERGHQFKKQNIWQNIDAASYINGELTPTRIKAPVTSANATKDNVKSIKDTIVDYFNTLIHSVK